MKLTHRAVVAMLPVVLAFMLSSEGCWQRVIRPLAPLVSKGPGKPDGGGAIDPTGKYVAVSGTGWVDIWDVQKHVLVRTLRPANGRSSCIPWFTGNGKLDVDCFGTGIYNYSVSTGKLLHIIKFGTPNEEQDGFAGHFLLQSARFSKVIKIWNLNSYSYRTIHSDYAHFALDASGDKLVATKEGDGSIGHEQNASAVLIDVPSGKILAKTNLPFEGDIEDLAASPDGKYALITGPSGIVTGHVWKWTFARPIEPWVPSPTPKDPDGGHSIFGLTISPNYQLVAVGLADTVFVLDSASAHVISHWTLKGYGNFFWPFSQDGKEMLMGDFAGAALYRTSDGKKLMVFPNGH